MTYRQALEKSLAALMPSLSPAGAAAVSQKVLGTMTKTTDPRTLAFLAESVEVLAERLPPEEAGRVSAVTARALLDATAKPTNMYSLAVLTGPVGKLASRLPPEEMGRLSAATVHKLLDTLATAKLPEGMFAPTAAQVLADAVVALAPHVSPKARATVAQEVIDRMATTTDPAALLSLAEAVGVLAVRLPPEESGRVAAGAAQKLLDAMAKPTSRYSLQYLARGLDKIASRLPGHEAGRVLASAARRLLDAMAEPTDQVNLGQLGQAAATLAAHLGPEEARSMSAAATQKLLDRIAKPTDFHGLSYLAELVGVLASHLPPEEAEQRVSVAAQKVLDTRAQTPAASTWSSDTGALVALARRLTGRGLVVVLQQPTCVGAGRETLLKELDRRRGLPIPEVLAVMTASVTAPPPSVLAAGAWVAQGESLSLRGPRPFAEWWEAVDWLHEHHPEWGLSSPPPRSAR
jgi:hypothetical protein